MQISWLEYMGVRNLIPQRIEFHPRLNCILGNNGSGKTSLLESIYLLGTGKSFRTTRMQYIKNGSRSCDIRAELVCQDDIYRIELHKTLLGDFKATIRDKAIKNRAQLVRALPLQLINSEWYLLIDGQPKERREFLDATAFHLEPEVFITVWRNMERILKQRNFLLKTANKFNPALLFAWDDQLVDAANKVTDARRRALWLLQQEANSVIQEFLPGWRLEMQYMQGWKEGEELKACLQSSQIKDYKIGSTTCGPQRADFLILCDNMRADEMLSRGQKKLLTLALLLARVQVIRQQTGVMPVFLLDDLASELDVDAMVKLLTQIKTLKAQVILTAIPHSAERALQQINYDFDTGKMFHVEHGKIGALNSMFHVEHKG